MPLTDTAIRKAKPTDEPQRLFGGGGLYLEISPARAPQDDAGMGGLSGHPAHRCQRVGVQDCCGSRSLNGNVAL